MLYSNTNNSKKDYIYTKSYQNSIKMDILTDILDNLLFQANFYFRTDLTRPWGIYIPPENNVARFHIVTRGHGWIRVDGQATAIPITNGDLVVVPHGAGHTILDDPSTAPQTLDAVLSEVSYTGVGPLIYGDGGPNTGLVCGEFSFDDAIHPLFTGLPPILHLTTNENRDKIWLDSTLRLIAHEAVAEQLGSLAIINRLAEIIFIQVVRTSAKAVEPKIPFLAALADSQLNRALSEIHRQPSAQWSVEKLGQVAGMSRSAFSNRFSKLLQMTPHQYLTLIRMQNASRTLAKTDKPIMAIALATGYKSEAAFSTAFKRFFDVRPGEYRKQYLETHSS